MRESNPQTSTIQGDQELLLLLALGVGLGAGVAHREVPVLELDVGDHDGRVVTVAVTVGARDGALVRVSHRELGVQALHLGAHGGEVDVAHAAQDAADGVDGDLDLLV